MVGVARPNIGFHVRNGQVIRPSELGAGGNQAAPGNRNNNYRNNNMAPHTNQGQGAAGGQAQGANQQQNNVNVNVNGNDNGVTEHQVLANKEIIIIITMVV